MEKIASDFARIAIGESPPPDEMMEFVIESLVVSWRLLRPILTKKGKITSRGERISSGIGNAVENRE